MGANVHIYATNFTTETRILKIITSCKANTTIERYMVFAANNHQPEQEYIMEDVLVYRPKQFIPKPKKSKILKAAFYIEWYIRILLFAKKQDISIVSCHSLAALPISILIKKLTKAKCVYETHELETERAGLSGVLKKLAKLVERKLIYALDGIVVVSNAYADWYVKEYPGITRPLVVRNIPDITNIDLVASNLRGKFKIPKEKLLFTYIGILNFGRGLEIIIEAFKKMPQHCLIIMGDGPYRDKVINEVKGIPNIFYHESVPSDQVLSYVRCCDVGLFLAEAICLSYEYALPNKFFEYVFSGCPLILSSLIECKKLIDKHNVGWYCDASAEDLIKCISEITIDDLNEKKHNTLAMREKFSWKEDAEPLCKLYQRLLKAVCARS